VFDSGSPADRFDDCSRERSCRDRSECRKLDLAEPEVAGADTDVDRVDGRWWNDGREWMMQVRAQARPNGE
jgi:hypothetical protein